jgi:hypothetical protein
MFLSCSFDSIVGGFKYISFITNYIAVAAFVFMYFGYKVRLISLASAMPPPVASPLFKRSSISKLTFLPLFPISPPVPLQDPHHSRSRDRPRLRHPRD